MVKIECDTILFCFRQVSCLLSFLLLVAARPNKLNQLTQDHDHNHNHDHDHDHDQEARASKAVETYLLPGDYDYISEASEAVDSYLPPDVDYAAASETVDSYLGPVFEESKIVTQTLDSYLGPSSFSDRDASPSEAVQSYALPRAPVLQPQASETVDSYLGPVFEESKIVTKTLDSYFGPSSFSDRDASPSEAVQSYALPRAGVLQPQASIAKTVKVAAPTAAPVAIVRSFNTGPQDGNYQYSFQTENGISQAVEGRMKMVDDTPVYVMKGEYAYIGADGNEWKVEWYADETGYHPSAPFLPKDVVPNHPGISRSL